MVEITDRDRALYKEANERSLSRRDWSSRELLVAIAAAREEGRQEERARCLAIVRKHWVREPAAEEIARGD